LNETIENSVRSDIFFSFFAQPFIHSSDEFIDWREMQTLVRSMPDLHKTLVLVNVNVNANAKDIDGNNNRCVDELAITTEHAPFRHKPKPIEVGAQKKNKNKKSKLEK
jgi:hypothetical protein